MGTWSAPTPAPTIYPSTVTRVPNALVFGAGTVFWVWGLDTNHDLNDLYPTAVDKNVQQACINLLPTWECSRPVYYLARG